MAKRDKKEELQDAVRLDLTIGKGGDAQTAVRNYFNSSKGYICTQHNGSITCATRTANIRAHKQNRCIHYQCIALVQIASIHFPLKTSNAQHSPSFL